MNIFVGNLPFSATDQSVRELFEPFGEVDSVNIIKDRETNRSRGFGFVEMSNSAEAQAAINDLNGKEMDGRALNINEARERGSRGGGGGGGRGGYGGGGRGGGRRDDRW